MWLAIKNKTGDDTLFVQHREEREAQIKELKMQDLIVPTIVVKKFDNKNEAEIYCKKINEISKLLNRSADGRKK